MSVSSLEINADTLTATVAAASSGLVLYGCHVFLPTGSSLGSVNAAMSMQSASIEARIAINASRTQFVRWNDGGAQNNNTGLVLPFDTWVSALHLIGPFDGSNQNNKGYLGSSNNIDSDATNNISENFTQAKLCGDHETASNASSFPGSIAEAFVHIGISEAQADAIATEAITLLPSAFTTAPDHYWPLLSNGNASLGGNDMTSGGSPTFDSGVHPTLGGGGAPATAPIDVIML